MNVSFVQFAAHDLYKPAKQLEEKDDDMIVATKDMETPMMHVSNFAK